MEKEKLLKELLEKERADREKREIERLEKERLEKERLEKERLEKEKFEKERLENERLVKEKLEKEKLVEKVNKEKELLRESITQAVIDSVNVNIEKIRTELIQKTISETTRAIERSLNSDVEKPKNETVHNGFTCNECAVFPIIGERYRCTICYDYDLCSKCEEILGEAHKHPFVKYRTNDHRGANFLPRCPRRYHDKQSNNIFKPLFIEDVIKKPDVLLVPNFAKNKFRHQLREMKNTYDFGKLTDDQILTALAKANGNMDEALQSLFQ